MELQHLNTTSVCAPGRPLPWGGGPKVGHTHHYSHNPMHTLSWGRSVADELAAYLKSNYLETDEERAERLHAVGLSLSPLIGSPEHLHPPPPPHTHTQTQQHTASLHRHHQVEAIFSIWDNDHSGYIEYEELMLVLDRWKEGPAKQAQEEGECEEGGG